MNDALLTRESAPRFIARINAITPTSQRQWGTMTPGQMFRHVALTLEASLGETEVEDRSSLFYKVVHPLLDYGIIKYPKGKAESAPEYIVDDQGDLETSRQELLDAVDRFLTFADENPNARPRHTFFGTLTITQWRRRHAKHLSHHLDQFGV